LELTEKKRESRAHTAGGGLIVKKGRQGDALNGIGQKDRLIK